MFWVCFVPQHMKHCLTVRGGRSMIRWVAVLSLEMAHGAPAVVSFISRSASISRTCSETMFSGSRHTPSIIKGILRGTFAATKRRTKDALRTLLEVTCSICFLTFSHLTGTRTVASFTARPASSAATQSLSAGETWCPHTQSAPDFFFAYTSCFSSDVN